MMNNCNELFCIEIENTIDKIENDKFTTEEK